jgi:hypothetical protein
MNKDIEFIIKKLDSNQKDLDNLKENLKILTENKNSLENDLINLLENNNLIDTSIKTNTYEFTYNKQNSYESVSKNFLENKLKEILKQNDVSNIIEQLYNSREKREKIIIKTKKLKT